MGYDSSASCDSFQLGEMVKFLTSKGLISFADFSPTQAASTPDFGVKDVLQIIATLKQCPNYQINKWHTQCGLRARSLHILEFMTVLLATNALGIVRKDWV